MDRNNGRYPYNIRRQNSGHGAPHSYHHHHNNNSAAGASNSPGYNNHSAGNSPSVGGHNNSNPLYASAAGQQQQQQQQPQSLPISQHDELIRYIREAWNKVYDQGPPVLYCNESDNQLKNFKPFDLEEYWGQRLVQNIHVTTTQAGGHQ
ncbi:MAPK regulated corepressor interacting protein 2 [Drosophila mauritiana]|uniref:MAPK regulated corepressor interacting protein 2 n=1 Tax=Drosophila mauritiana TaxID=7226 RepID=A0A6P8JF51_DROMA|nr:MAPK regulated corepressor interacting protein 2 [Drosophila mauritiana]